MMLKGYRKNMSNIHYGDIIRDLDAWLSTSMFSQSVDLQAGNINATIKEHLAAKAKSLDLLPKYSGKGGRGEFMLDFVALERDLHYVDLHIACEIEVSGDPDEDFDKLLLTRAHLKIFVFAKQYKTRPCYSALSRYLAKIKNYRPTIDGELWHFVCIDKERPRAGLTATYKHGATTAYIGATPLRSVSWLNRQLDNTHRSTASRLWDHKPIVTSFAARSTLAPTDDSWWKHP